VVASPFSGRLAQGPAVSAVDRHHLLRLDLSTSRGHVRIEKVSREHGGNMPSNVGHHQAVCPGR